MALREAFEKLALILQEAADSELSHNDLHSALNDACSKHGGMLVDCIGDGKSGDAIMHHEGKLKKAPYSIDTVNGKRTASLDMDSAQPVQASTNYSEIPDEDDYYAHMESAAKKAKLYTALPLYERVISKAERDAADASSFAGKGKSYPILKPEDVSAAVHAMGRAGAGNVGTSTLKANIIRIAKAKGWGNKLPASWQGGDDDDKKESFAAGTFVGDTKLVESFAFVDTIKLSEVAKSDYEVKLIAPGKGSSAYYPAEVLKRDGPKVFTSGTHMYWNHATDMEEAQRPEGDLNNLAAVLTSDATYKENGPAGPGLYAKAKVFADYAPKVAEMGPHIGLSIRASGNVEKGKMQEGRPVLKEMVFADSADFVTKAGAGGMVLMEAARSTKLEEGDGDEMDSAELRKLNESNKKLAQRLALFEARDFADAEIGKLRLPDAAKQRIRERVVANAPLTSDGVLDEKAFAAVIVAEAKDEAEYLNKLTGGRNIVGMGTAPLTEADPKEFQKAVTGTFEDLATTLGLSESAKKAFVAGRTAA